MESARVLSHVPAIQRGVDHEDVAREAYLELEHIQYSVTGLHVNPSFPDLGATPDRLISCKCCGEGLIEISALTETNTCIIYSSFFSSDMGEGNYAFKITTSTITKSKGN